MDGKQFDAFARTLRLRRAAVSGLLGGAAALLGLVGPEEAAAHNRVPACKPIKDPQRRLRCLRRARAHNRWHQRCAASTVATCAARCGSLSNSCGQPVRCSCPAGKTCLGSGSCAQICTDHPQCPTGCFCGAPSVEGPRPCAPSSGATCDQLQTPCTSTTQCPVGAYCLPVPCGSGGAAVNRCLPLGPS